MSAGRSSHPTLCFNTAKTGSDTGELVRSLAETSGVEISLDRVGQTAMVRGDAMQLQQVFANLLSNARQAMPNGGVMDVSLAEQTESNLICISIPDSGVGIEREQLSPMRLGHAFEPCYTTKDVGQGDPLKWPRVWTMDGCRPPFIALSVFKPHCMHVSCQADTGTRSSWCCRFHDVPLRVGLWKPVRIWPARQIICRWLDAVKQMKR